jgi:hypothetical protein
MRKSDEVQAILPLIQRFVGTQPEALEQIRDQIQSELEHYEGAILQARAQLAAIDQVIAGIKKAPPMNGPPPVPFKSVGAPPLRKAILFILDDRSPNYVARDEILAELDRRGWGPGGKTPRNTVISRLSELVRDEIVERSGNKYRLPPADSREAVKQRLP